MPVPTDRESQRSHLGRQIRDVRTRLVRQYELVPPALVGEYLHRAVARFNDAAVLDFVPILVERDVRARLRTTHPAYHDRIALIEWARRSAETFLAEELPRRWTHVQAVARRAGQIAGIVAPSDRAVLIAAAWLHDIGYASELAATGMHQLDGAWFLARHGVPHRVCSLVAHHSGAAAVAELLGLDDQLAWFRDERTPVRDALWYCDMTTGPDGDTVSFEDRVREIRARRSPDHPTVRALATNLPDRRAAVRRTAHLLGDHAA